MMNPSKVVQAYVEDPRRQLEGLAHMPSCSVFFEPRSHFVTWMVEFCEGRPVVDCGCGLGNTVAALRQAGLNVCAIDLYPSADALIPDIVPMNAPMFPFRADMVVLMCRPCRGDWICATICKAIEAGAVVIYVGKRSHYEEDLEPLPYHIERVMINAGASKEVAWLVQAKAMDTSLEAC